MCDHWYPTKTCGRSNPTVRSSWDNETSPDPGGRVLPRGKKPLGGSGVEGRPDVGQERRLVVLDEPEVVPAAVEDLTA